MRRNPLLRRFQTLFADFEDAERTGRPVAEVREQRRRADISRRDFLKYSGAAVGAAAFAPSTAHGRMVPDRGSDVKMWVSG